LALVDPGGSQCANAHAIAYKQDDVARLAIYRRIPSQPFQFRQCLPAIPVCRGGRLSESRGSRKQKCRQGGTGKMARNGHAETPLSPYFHALMTPMLQQFDNAPAYEQDRRASFATRQLDVRKPGFRH
jgi:hypothetical protein